MAAFLRRNDSDAAVVRRVLTGQREDFGVLVRRYLPAVQAVGRARIGNAADAEDAAQETFIKAYLSLDTLREPASFGAWLLSITRNIAHNFQRSQARRLEREREALAATPQPTRAPDEDEVRHVLQARLAELEEPAREILLLHYYAGKSTKELADLLGISRDAVKKRLQRAREALGEQMLHDLKPAESQQRREARIIAAVAALHPSWAAVVPATGLVAAFGFGAALKTVAVLAVTAIGAGWWAFAHKGPGNEPLMPPKAISVQPVASSAQETRPSAPASPAAPAAVTSITPAASTPPTTGVIEGRVYDAASGTGISGVDMLIKGGGKPIIATSDSDGRFRAADLQPGDYTVHRDYAPLKGYPEENPEERQNVVLRAGETLTVDCPLSQGTVIAGRVTDEAGNPLGGVRLGAVTNQENQWRHGISEPDGQFVIPGFEGPGQGFEVCAMKTGFAMQPLYDLTVPAGGLHDLALVMIPESTISGTVVDADGNPLEDVGVEARLLGESVYGSGTNPTTGKRGEFSLAGLCPGSISIIITDPGFSTYATENTVAEIELGREEHIKDLVLVSKWRPGLAISGRMLYSNGEHVNNGLVFVKNKLRWGQVDSDGRYRIDGLDPGNYDVVAVITVGALSLREVQDDVPAGSTDVDLVFDPPVEARGTVVDAESGQPITDFEITVDAGIKPELDRSAEWQFRRFQDQEGRFLWPALAPGDITFYARAPGYAQQYAHLTAKAGQALENVRIALSRGVTIEGVVRNHAQEPVPNSSIYLGPVPKQQHRTHSTLATTGPQGEFTLHVPPGGPQVISAYHDDYAPVAVSVPLTDKTVHTEIVLNEGGSIDGTLTRDGVPLSAHRVFVISGETHSDTVPTDENGHFSISNIVPGNAVLTVNLKAPGFGGYSLQQPVVVREGVATHIQLVVPSGTAAIEGAKDFGGLYGQLHLQIPLDSGASFNVNLRKDDDSYSFTGLPAGPATLEAIPWDEAAKKNREAVSIDVNLVEGQTVRQDIQVP